MTTTSDKKVIYQGPIGALLGTDEDYAAVRKEIVPLVEGKLSPDEIQKLVEAVVAQRVDARECG